MFSQEEFGEWTELGKEIDRKYTCSVISNDLLRGWSAFIFLSGSKNSFKSIN